MSKKAALKKKLEETVEVFDCEQRSDEWFALHVGVLTASRFGPMMADGRDGGESITRRKLLFMLAAERLTGKPGTPFRNAAMERGIEMEPTLRDAYARRTFVEVKQVGFIKRTIPNGFGSELVVGCSPDALVGDDGLLELKSMEPHLLLELAEVGASAAGRHKPQIQGQLWVSGRAWCDLRFGWDGFNVAPTFRVERDESYISRLKDECERFEWEVQQLVKKYPKPKE